LVVRQPTMPHLTLAGGHSCRLAFPAQANPSRGCLPYLLPAVLCQNTSDRTPLGEGNARGCLGQIYAEAIAPALLPAIYLC